MTDNPNELTIENSAVLHKIFRKLGISSRNRLHAALGRDAGTSTT